MSMWILIPIDEGILGTVSIHDSRKEATAAFRALYGVDYDEWLVEESAAAEALKADGITTEIIEVKPGEERGLGAFSDPLCDICTDGNGCQEACGVDDVGEGHTTDEEESGIWRLTITYENGNIDRIVPGFISISAAEDHYERNYKGRAGVKGRDIFVEYA